jgi:hypothetical protein
MQQARTLNDFGRKNIAVLAAIAVSAMVATPFVMSASRALATPEEPTVTTTLRVDPVEISPVAAPKEAAPCLRKVRVVYSGYGTPSDACTTR